jgi:hypothetical protein
MDKTPEAFWRSLGDYLRQIFSLFPAAWRHGQLIMNLVVAALSGLALWLGFLMDAYPIKTLYTGITIIVAIELIFVAPFVLWKKQKEEIKRLEDRLSAKFVFRIEPEQVFWLNSEGTSNGPKLFHNYIVGIQNTSNTNLKNVFVQLDRMVIGPPLPRMKRKLRLRDSEKYIFDLAPQKTEYIWVARIEMHATIPDIEFMVEDKKGDDKIPGGFHQIKLKAYAENCNPMNRFFAISAHETGGGFGGIEAPKDDIDDK